LTVTSQIGDDSGATETRRVPADGVFQSWSACFEISSDCFYKKKIMFFLMISPFRCFHFLSC